MITRPVISTTGENRVSRKLGAALSFAACSVVPGGIVAAQQSRHEITKATTSADDAKPNSNSVPDVYALTGKFDRVAVPRFRYQADRTAPADLIGMNGYVVNGAVHTHMTLANPDHAFGGHLGR